MKSAIAILVFYATYAAAHANIVQITIDGKVYKGNLPNANPSPSIIRQVSENGPVKGTSNPNLACGMNSKNADLMADAMPGSTVSFTWGGGGGNKVPHAVGPSLTYLASCGSESCATFDASNAQWFKISQVGRNSDGTWVIAGVSDGTISVKLPSTLSPGNYLARHEVIALQGAVSKGGAEFYTACAQIKVGGSGTGKAQQSELVTFPGAYNEDDPGIYVPDVFNSGQTSYVFPGPPVAAIAGGDSSPSSRSDPSSLEIDRENSVLPTLGQQTGMQTGTDMPGMPQGTGMPTNGPGGPGMPQQTDIPTGTDMPGMPTNGPGAPPQTGTGVPGGPGMPQQTDIPTGTDMPGMPTNGPGAPPQTGTGVPGGPGMPQQTDIPTGTDMPGMPTNGPGAPPQTGTGVPGGPGMPQQTDIPTGTDMPGMPHETGMPTNQPEIPHQTGIPTDGPGVPQQTDLPTDQPGIPQQTGIPPDGPGAPQQTGTSGPHRTGAHRPCTSSGGGSSHPGGQREGQETSGNLGGWGRSISRIMRDLLK
ncbi:lytic polysaccharide monooxygenase [Amanita thiersii Skay4041]|uniref:lytic cellulose monooxygenase (C4-dehydrogenating) n=1 Tax=Amanita thiersii Skay4041 TaxID=703135 RepID=A0A2A9NE79_9AGAR|nr:lytic polysaccharide monooxygenase [Amanita thiersii Skay4041]